MHRLACGPILSDSSFLGAATAVERLSRAVAEWREVRRQRPGVAVFDDRLFEDIGLVRLDAGHARAILTSVPLTECW